MEQKQTNKPLLKINGKLIMDKEKIKHEERFIQDC